MGTRTSLAVSRSNYRSTEIRTEDVGQLAEGAVRLTIDHVALTANTITYAQFGDMLAYWSFYPLDDEWGYVPAIGWATVAESTVTGIDPGTTVHGWFPMSTSVDIEAEARPGGIYDVGEHRAPHAGTYRNFVADGTDPADRERHSLLRGLYGTGHLIDSFFGAARFATVEQTVVLSASSKTAIGYAFAADRSGAGGSRVGVTSQRNVEFVESLDLYDEVATYDDIAGVATRPTAIVDMAGAGATVAALHARLGDNIVHSMLVGKSHHDDPGAPVVGGPQPEMFFAPSEVDRLSAELGPAVFREQMSSGASAFVDHSRNWLELEHHVGPENFAAAWSHLLTGDVPPSIGVIAGMNES